MSRNHVEHMPASTYRVRLVNRVVAFGALACAAAWPASACAQVGTASATHAAVQASARTDAVPSDSASPLRSGDAIRLRIWREPDLSGDFTVDDQGIVTLPKLGPVQAAGEPIDALKSRVTAAYAAYLNQPSIEVIPLRRIRVAGSVKNPGLYTVDPTVTIADALTLAGGTTPQGKNDVVRLIRDGKSTDVAITQDPVFAQSRLRSGDQLYVPERGWFSRNAGLVFAGISAIATLIWALHRAGV
jgi:polysaccharide export outer membrane protein